MALGDSRKRLKLRRNAHRNLREIKMKKALLILVIAGLTACTDPKSTIISTADSDKEKMQEVMKKLSDEERQLVAAYMMRTLVSGAMSGKADLPIGVTVGDAIKQQKEWIDEQKKKEAEQAALKAKLAAEAEAFRREVESAVTVTVIEKSVLPKDIYRSRYSDIQVIKLGFENKSGKDIAGIEGELAFYDIFDKEVGSINFSYDDGIKAGATSKWTGTRDINEFRREHRALANLEEGKYTTKFKPETIVFADGTKLKASKAN